MMAFAVATPAFAAETTDNTQNLKQQGDPAEPFATPISTTYTKKGPDKSVKAYDAAGWQLVATDSWYVDNYTVTEPRSFAGGGVKACFYDQAFSYSVQLKENDPFSPDDTIGVPRYVSSSDGDCVVWSGVNTEPGNEELYLIFTKASTTTDIVTVKWYD